MLENNYFLEVNVGKTKIMRISGTPSPVQVMIEQKQLEDLEYLNCLCNMMTNDSRLTPEIKFRVIMAKAAFNKKKALFTSKVDSNLK